MIQIKATNIELTDAIRDYIEKKFSIISKFVDEKQIERMYIDVGKTTNHHKHGDVFRAECNATISGKKYYATSEQGELYAAIDDLQTELVREINGEKGRARKLWRRGAQKIKTLLKNVPGFRN